MDLHPESYQQNQARLRGISTNLYDANLLGDYLYHAARDRADKEKLKAEIMNKVFECLANIDKARKYTKLPDDEIVIKDCQNVVYGMPTSEMRDLLERFDTGKMNDTQKIKAILEYL